MKSNEIRNAFLEYFENSNHKIMPSASLIPIDDTLCSGSPLITPNVNQESYLKFGLILTNSSEDPPKLELKRSS